MTKQTKITMNLDGLESLKAQLGSGYIARVGILGSDAAADHYQIEEYTNKKGEKKERRVAGNITNAEIGVVHEFGSETNNIPARSFLRMPLTSQSRDIVRFMGTKAITDLVEKGEVKKVFALLGLYAETIVNRAFETGGFGKWPKLKIATVIRKGSAAPLIDTRQLNRSISSDVVKQ